MRVKVHPDDFGDDVIVVVWSDVMMRCQIWNLRKRKRRGLVVWVAVG